MDGVFPNEDVELPKESSVKVLLPRREREFFTVNLLVQIHLIIEMILVDRPCAMGVVWPPRSYS